MSFQMMKLLSLIVIAVVLTACTPSEVKELPAAAIAPMFERAGWKRLAEDTPAAQTVAQFIAQQTASSEQAIQYTHERKDNGYRISAKAPTGDSFLFFRSEKSGHFSWLDADAAMAYAIGVENTVANAPVQILTRDSYINAMSSGDAQAKWSGCILLHGDSAIHGISLRLTLLTTNDKGHRNAWPGKSRHSTSRSGIPETLSPGGFFCSKLKSGRYPKPLAKTPPAASHLVIEAIWKDSSDRLSVGTIWQADANWGDYSGRMVSMRAVVNEDIAAEPRLVRVSERKGENVLIHLPEKEPEWMAVNKLTGLYPESDAAVDSELAKSIGKLLNLMAEGKIEIAARWLQWSGTTSIDPYKKDLQRRFPFTAPLEFSNIDLAILDVIAPSEDKIVVTYFARIRKQQEIKARVFDTISAVKTGSGWRFERAKPLKAQ